MSYTVATLESRILQKLDNTAFDTTKLLQFLNDGQRDLVILSRLLQSRAEGTWTTTDGTDALTTSVTDMLVPLSFRITLPAASAGVLDYIEQEDLDIIAPDVSAVPEGAPTAWLNSNGTPKVYPYADQTYTLKGRYLKVPAELVTTADVPLWPEVHSEILVLAGYKRALIHDDQNDKAQLVQVDIDEMLTAMKRVNIPNIGTPHIMRQPRRIGNRLGRR